MKSFSNIARRIDGFFRDKYWKAFSPVYNLPLPCISQIVKYTVTAINTEKKPLMNPANVFV